MENRKIYTAPDVQIITENINIVTAASDPLELPILPVKSQNNRRYDF